MGYSSPSNLIELIQANTTLEEKLKQYEGEFEWDEFWTCSFIWKYFLKIL